MNDMPIYQPEPVQPAPVPTPEKPKKKHRFVKFVVVPAAAVVAIVAIMSAASGEDAPAPPPADHGNHQVAEPEAQPPAQDEPELTVAQQSAVDSANSYLETVGGFSRTGLIDQLKFEGFSVRDATFAVDHLDIDWNAQAVQSAKSYMENVGGFSKQGLVDQLRFEGFTPAQAQYGANQAYR